jgi:hypothetical protein
MESTLCLFVVVTAAVGIGDYCLSNGTCGKHDNGGDNIVGGQNPDSGSDVLKVWSVSDKITSHINSISISGPPITLNGTHT